MFRLLGWLRKRERGPGDIPTRAEFDALTKRLEALDELQILRETTFVELTTQLRRQLGRLAAYKQRDEAGGAEDGQLDVRDLVRLKYPKIGG